MTAYLASALIVRFQLEFTPGLKLRPSHLQPHQCYLDQKSQCKWNFIEWSDWDVTRMIVSNASILDTLHINARVPSVRDKYINYPTWCINISTLDVTNLRRYRRRRGGIGEIWLLDEGEDKQGYKLFKRHNHWYGRLRFPMKLCRNRINTSY